MSTSLEKRFSELLGMCSEQERRELLAILLKNTQIHKLEAEWSTTAQVVLEAIHRAKEVTQRMFRGILAEAACKVEVIDKLTGWKDVGIQEDSSYDFKIQKGNKTVAIEVKLQRSEQGVPKRAKCKGLNDPSQYVVETQRTRGGKKKRTEEKTRPYRFGEFDILAVAMKPATGDWASFRFTPCRWLIPNAENPEWLATYQPVSLEPNNDWTDDLETCIKWHLSTVQKTIHGAAPPKTARSTKQRRPRKAKLT